MTNLHALDIGAWDGVESSGLGGSKGSSGGDVVLTHSAQGIHATSLLV